MVNMKAVIVWVIAIVIFAGIGLFGMANQHLLDEKVPTPPTPGDTGTTEPTPSTTHNVTCTASTANGNSSYMFTVDDATNSLTSVSISYQSTVPIDYIYASANNLAGAAINGITTNLSGDATNFSLSMDVNLQGYDSALLANYQNDLTNVSAVIENLSDIEMYKSALNGTGNVYTCN